jgi:hypothetical protein
MLQPVQRVVCFTLIMAHQGQRHALTEMHVAAMVDTEQTSDAHAQGIRILHALGWLLMHHCWKPTDSFWAARCRPNSLLGGGASTGRAGTG